MDSNPLSYTLLHNSCCVYKFNCEIVQYFIIEIRSHCDVRSVPLHQEELFQRRTLLSSWYTCLLGCAINNCKFLIRHFLSIKLKLLKKEKQLTPKKQLTRE